MSWDDLSQPTVSWPTVREVNDYRRQARAAWLHPRRDARYVARRASAFRIWQVYAAVRGVIESHDGLAPGAPAITDGSPLWALFMAFEHERIHLETSSARRRL